MDFIRVVPIKIREDEPIKMFQRKVFLNRLIRGFKIKVQTKLVWSLNKEKYYAFLTKMES